ncbi:YggS family pyridoxal phosphate enzyme [Ammoniphilus oxalaticus]|uniref:Pyridoxal phosphate homeostasis protein n=1 Tax=Ammoniphilus oxalaticus TaxID=66863 RepID=A0A419SJC3_9BACL|nr:YggS family pyridoxal phosphate-dependent enzyme [Ammoniphilus oxalaticus]RKD24113.1 YggS family pyridoxal phosphate enzyme [Ammoniphilus oxalaticus]
MNMKESVDQVKQRIEAACKRANRDPNEINLVAVTKYVGMDRAKAVLQEGIQHIGESRVQDALPKWEALQGGQATWHFIGNLQTNKVKDVVGKFSYIHSLDRESLAKEIERRGRQNNVVTNCFVQVNISGEETKSGLEPNQVLEFVKKTSKMKYIKICGLMTMAPYELDSEQTRPIFRKLRQLRDECNQLGLPNVQIEHLSMGMSNDFEVAIEEGATFIRLGSSLVGKD